MRMRLTKDQIAQLADIVEEAAQKHLGPDGDYVLAGHYALKSLANILHNHAKGTAVSEPAVLTYHEKLERLVKELVTEANGPLGLNLDRLFEIVEKMRVLVGIPKSDPPKATDHASTAPGPVNCKIWLSFRKEVVPRTCPRCGLGHCPFFHNDGSSKQKGNQ